MQIGVLFAQTNVESNISETWNEESSPNNVTGNVSVGNGQTLTTEPDIKYQFMRNITSKLQEEMSISSDEEFIRVNISLSDNYGSQKMISETSEMTKHEKREYVTSNLKEFSAHSQARLILQLNELASAYQVRKIKPLWIVNIINCEMTRKAIETLSARDDIGSIDYDEFRKILLAPTISDDSNENLHEIRNGREITWNVTKVNADDVWNLGYSGSGIVVAVLDTGVNYNHTDLNDHLWIHPDYPYYGYDFINNDNDPMDDNGSGTHCAGTVAGDGTSGSQTGVAPDAAIMCLKLMDAIGNSTESVCWTAIEFAVDNGADVLSISFTWMNANRTAWRNVMNYVLAADVFAAVAAGYYGDQQTQFPIPGNVGTPGDCPPPWLHPDQTLAGGLSSVVCIGATNSDDECMSFSSRGPVTWENVEDYNDYAYNPEMGLIRPDISAPGANIKSLAHDNNTGYDDGLYGSIATPCVAGVIALMLSKNHDLTPAQLDQLIEENVAVAQSPKNNDLGSGRIDALASVNEIPILQLTLIAPNGGEFFVMGNTTSITWGSTLIPDIKIEYSIDNGSNWIEIIASTPAASRNYEWIVPNILSDQCKVKITDIIDDTNYDESDVVFEIIAQNILGGPYAIDENTVLLFSFEGDLTNRSSLSGDAIPHGPPDGPLISYETHDIAELSQCLRIENSYEPGVQSWESYLTVPHDDNLSLTGDWTIEAWINMSSEVPYYPVIIFKPGDVTNHWIPNYTWARTNMWEMACTYYTHGTNSNVSIVTQEGLIQLGNWYHISYIRDTSDRSLKILVRNQNREVIADVAGYYSPDQDIPATSDLDLYIGKMFNEEFFFFDGYIDELRISNVVRTYNVNPIADFEANETSGVAPLTVNFSDLSTQGALPITIWEWDFDNDGTIDSYEQNPIYTYSETGIYSVSLTVSDGTNSDTEIKIDYIVVEGPITADFEANPLSGIAPLEVQFTDLSISNDLQEWNSHTSNKKQLMTQKNKSSKSKKSESEKSYSSRDRDIVSWEWDFDNDGTIDSYEQNPLHTYTEIGIYTVSLTVTDENDISDTETKVNYISVSDACALQFDGTNDYVEVNNMAFPVNNLTIEAWIYIDDFITDQYIVTGYGPTSGAQFRVSPEGSLLYGEYSPWTFIESDANSIQSNVWTHVAVTKQGNNWKLYIDGLNSASSQLSSSSTTSTLHIGCRGVNMDGFFNGKIDEVRMWNIARTQTEIQTYMNNYLEGTESGLTSYWQMNENNGQIVYDLSGNGNNGQLGSTPGNDTNDPVWIITDWPYGILQADFSASPVSGAAPLSVDFTDLSFGEPTNWEWDFDNDGTTDSNEQNPSYTYSEAGTYTVSLAVSDGTYTDIEIKVDYIDVTFTDVEIETIPLETKLFGNHPNPFNPSTIISFSVTQNSNFVILEVYNIKGQKVNTLVNQDKDAGYHSVNWNGDDEFGNSLSSGIYLYKLNVNGKTEAVKKCLLLK